MPLSHAGALLANLSVTWSECDLVHVSSSYSDIIISYVILQSMFYYEYVCINFIKAYLCPYALGWALSINLIILLIIIIISNYHNVSVITFS